ncbi:MAG: hypothetical protein MUE99_09780 [Chitinophagaceae bacterium]|nr:hypothetical protein [Chitinophagaceae bacterium]
MKNLFVKTLLLAVLYLGATDLVFGQSGGKTEKPSYKTALGVKYAPFAITLKNFSRTKNRAFELLANFNDGFRLTGLYEYHGNLNAAGNVKWYVGFGGHTGYYKKDSDEGVMLGLDAVGGFDYKFKRAPINISIDWQPAFEFITPETEFQGGRGGIAVRFAF